LIPGYFKNLLESSNASHFAYYKCKLKSSERGKMSSKINRDKLPFYRQNIINQINKILSKEKGKILNQR